MWIESHQSLRNHPKTLRAARALGIPEVLLIGHLHCLWWWALDYAPDGNLASYDATDIALAAEWTGDPDVFVSALRDAAKVGERAGFLEVREDALNIHDWWDYGGKLIHKREQDAARKRTRRQDAPQSAETGTPTRPQDVQRTSSGHPADVHANITRQDKQDKQDKTGQDRTPPTRADTRANGHAPRLTDSGGDGAVTGFALSPEQSVAVELVQQVAPNFRDIEGFVRDHDPRQVAYWALAAGQDVERLDNPAGLIRGMVQKEPKQWPNLPADLIQDWKSAVSKISRSRAL